VSDPILAGLDAGEKEAIGLAVKIEADLVLLDEARGRAASEHFRPARVGLIDPTNGRREAPQDELPRLSEALSNSPRTCYQTCYSPQKRPQTGSRTGDQEEGSD
jgi:hypothetical protein